MADDHEGAVHCVAHDRGRPGRVIAEFETLTPMFVGPDSEHAELRVPSIKGMLRFWWRALAWQRTAADTPEPPLAALRREEERLFGTAASEEKARDHRGQSLFLMRLQPGPAAQAAACGTFLHHASGPLVGPGARYLGYGLMGAFGKDAGQLKRPCLAAGTKFVIELLFKRTASEAEVNAVLDAVRLFGLLGGVGARSRRGWGSVQLLSLTEQGQSLFDVPTTPEAYARTLQTLLPAGTATAPYTVPSSAGPRARICAWSSRPNDCWTLSSVTAPTTA